MIRTYPKLSVFLLVFVTFAISVVIVKARSNRPTPPVVEKIVMPTDAAFRDGLYLGKLHAESGRAPHLSVGRWNSPKDRASFVAGYEQSYRDTQIASGKTPLP